jgi:hypothetical protein
MKKRRKKQLTITAGTATFTTPPSKAGRHPHIHTATMEEHPIVAHTTRTPTTDAAACEADDEHAPRAKLLGAIARAANVICWEAAMELCRAIQQSRNVGLVDVAELLIANRCVDLVHDAWLTTAMWEFGACRQKVKTHEKEKKKHNIPSLACHHRMGGEAADKT